MKIFHKFILFVGLTLEKISCVLIAFVAIIVVSNVLARTLLAKPIIGITEIMQYSVFLAVCLGTISATSLNIHSRVDIMALALSKKGGAILLLITRGLSTVLYAFIAYNMIPIVQKAMKSYRTLEMLSFIPYWCVNLLVLVCVVGLVIVYLYQTLEQFMVIVGKEEVMDTPVLDDTDNLL